MNSPCGVPLTCVSLTRGAKVLFGGRPLSGAKAAAIPKVYGAWEPTAVFVPLKEMLKQENFAVCTTEIFGPFQVLQQ